MKKGYCWLMGLCSWAAVAQTSTAEICEQKEQSVRETILLRHIDEANLLYKQWFTECPSQRDAQFTLRMELLDYAMMEDFPNRETAGQEFSNLVKPIYTEFPQYRNNLLMKEAYGLFLFEGDKKQIVSKFEEAFNNKPQAFTSDEMRVYFDVATDDLANTDWRKLLQLQDKIELFIHADGRLDAAMANNYFRLLDQMQEVNNRLVPADSVVPYYKKQAEDYLKNADWHLMVLQRLDNKGVRLDPFTAEIAERSYRMVPNRRAAEILGLVNYQKGNLEQAEYWYLKAISHLSDKAQIAERYFNLGAVVCLATDKAKAKTYLLKAGETAKEQASAYVLLAQLYHGAIKDCATTDQEKAALQLLAVRMLDKAAASNPSMKAGLETTKQKYLVGFPTKEELKKNKWNGKSVSITCWINEKVSFDK